MSTAPAARQPFSPALLWQGGRLLLGAVFALALLLVLYLTWSNPDLLPIIPAAVVGGAALVYLFRHPLLNLCTVLALFVLVIDYEAGIQLSEVVYGLYYMAFLAHWFFAQRFLYQERILRSPEDKALFLFLVLMSLSVFLTLLFGGDMGGFVSEWTAMILLAFYFPVKEACLRYRHGVKLILLVLAWFGLFVTLRNLFEYQAGIASIKYTWQVAKIRIVTNDNVLLVSSLTALVLLIFAERTRTRLLLLGGFLMVFSGLILTLSRGNWLAFGFGAFVVFLLVGARHKRRMLLLGSAGFAGFLLVGMLFFGDLVILFFAGLIDRFASIGSATTQDISLLSRIVEARAAWEHVAINPVLGHGMSVYFEFYDIITRTTVVRTFIHNGYLSLWYRFGLWGLGLVLFFWACCAWRGMQVFRMRGAAPPLRLAGLAAAGVLSALVLTNLTSNPFFLSDSILVFALVTGLASGAYRRAELERALPPRT